MIFKRIRNLITSRNASALGGGPADTHSLPPDLVPIAELLSVRASPRPEFLDSLERQLLRAQVTRSGSAFPPLRLPRVRWLVRIAVAATVLAATIAAMFVASGRGSQPEVASAMVLADATQKLLGLHTVRYQTLTEISHGACYSVFNAPLTEADKAVLIERGEEPVDRGILYGCYEGPLVSLEEGVYDLDNQAFSAATRLVKGETGIHWTDRPSPFDPRYRLYVDGKLYWKEEGGEWSEQPTRNRWAPFTFDGFAQVPAGNLDALTAAYDQVLKLGEEKIDGVRVAHYRASRSTYAGPETVEAWIGVEDGLPRRAVVAVETEESEEWQLKFITDRLSDPEKEKYRNDPIILRGKWPSEKVITYTYTFSDFNEPVKIAAPVP